MPKAELTLPNGTKITIDGTPEEVAALLATYSSAEQDRGRRSTRRKTKPKAPRAATIPEDESKPKRTGALDLIRELKGEDFFRAKRTIGDVRQELETRGHIYPVTSLSGLLLQLVRSRELGRIKEDRVWKYVHR